MAMELSLTLKLTPELGLRATKFQCKCWNNSSSTLKLQTLRPLQRFRINVASNDPTTVDYSSMSSSVFPAEACETVGGEACDVDAIYPEVKLTPQTDNVAKADPTESVDREYLQYDGPKTVFPGEACDDLGGEFCEPEYQSGVY